MSRRGREPGRRVVIYALADAASPDVIRYVGATARPMERLDNHLSAVRSRRFLSNEQPVRRWLSKEHPDLVMSCLEFCDGPDADERELHWIVEFRRRGMADMNVVNVALSAGLGIPVIKNHGMYRVAARARALRGAA